MKAFYSVTTIVRDDGSVSAHITSTKTAEKAPKNTVTSRSDKDIYVDWFDSYDEAAKFADDAKFA